MSLATINMPRPSKERADEPKRNDVTVKVDADVVRVCKMVASSRGITLAEYISESMRPIAQNDLDQDTRLA